MWLRASSLLVLTAAGLCGQEGRPVYTLIVSGAVERSSPGGDTSLPPDVRIAADCHGDYVDGGLVSPSGQFRFTFKPDPISVAASSLCTIEAKVFGYESTAARFSVRSANGMVNVGTITITRNSAGDAEDQGSKVHSGPTVSATSLKAPAEAVKRFAQGQKELRQKKLANAVKSFEAAIRIYPEYADAWMNLGLLAVQRNDLMTGARNLDEALRLDPQASFQACYSDALVNLALKRYDVAERAARGALKFGDGGANARIDYVLGMALLARGGNVEARQRLMRYLELAPGAPEREQVERELTRLDRLAGAKN
jgi:tetratricopeptide (TPR) repeat protein